MQKNYKGDGLDLAQSDIALVSNEKCYQVMHDFPDKFTKLEFKDISTETLKHIYDNSNKLIEKINGQLIYDAELFDLLVDNPIKLTEDSEMAILQKEKLTDSSMSIKNQSEKSRNVFVIHGRNEKARNALFQFLRAIDLDPLEWSQLIAGTGKGSPYIGEILESAFQTAQAVIVLMTGDDLANIREIYLGKDEKPEPPSPQARPNVLFEAGMAFGRNPDKTIIVELGKTRKYSDIEGRHVIRMDNSPEKRNELVRRLKKAGCKVKNEEKDDWYKEGDFEAALPPENVSAKVKFSVSSELKEKSKPESSKKAKAISISENGSLSEDEDNILKFINDFGDKGITSSVLAIRLKINHGRVKHFLNKLVDSTYIYYTIYSGRRRFWIGDKGLEYLVEQNII